VGIGPQRSLSNPLKPFSECGPSTQVATQSQEVDNEANHPCQLSPITGGGDGPAGWITCTGCLSHSSKVVRRLPCLLISSCSLRCKTYASTFPSIHSYKSSIVERRLCGNPISSPSWPHLAPIHSCVCIFWLIILQTDDKHDQYNDEVPWQGLAHLALQQCWDDPPESHGVASHLVPLLASVGDA
jgi:hypothetical protein